MYRVIEKHINMLLDSAAMSRDVSRYVWLQQNFRTVNVAEDRNFQGQYRLYWGMNQARLSDQFLGSYFALFERLKRQRGQVNVDQVARSLYRVPTHEVQRAQGARQTLQYSFSTKMVHMLRPDLPIYDRAVEAFFFLPKKSGGSFDQKLTTPAIAYEFLIQEYRRILDQGLLTRAIARFRARYDPNHIFTQVKIIDTIIWRFVTFLWSGAIRDQVVSYS